MKKRFRIDVRVGAEATKIDRAAKTVNIRQKSAGGTGEGTAEYVERYDRLLLATGSAPLRQDVPGGDDPRISPLWTIPDSDEIVRRIDGGARRALVVGAGAIGLEAAENLRLRGVETTVVARSQVVKTVDRETSRLVLDELNALGVRVELGRQVVAFEPTSDKLTAVLDDGRRLAVDFVLNGVGVRPNSELAIAAGLETGRRGHIVVDSTGRTSDPAIFAAGDVVEVVDPTTGEKTAIALAGPANKQGRIAADAIFDDADVERDGSNAENSFRLEYPGTFGASILKVGAVSVGSVGWTEKRLKSAKKPFRKIYVVASSNAGFYPGGTPIFIKLLFAPDDGKILGAQCVGRRGVDKRIDVVSTAARFGGTVFELATLELSYAPPFSSAKDPLNDAGTVAVNVLTGKSDVVYPDEIPDGALLLDVRTREEFELATIPGAINVPLDELRDRLGELDPGQKIVAFCQVGKRGYFAERILRGNGFDVSNLSGGFTAWRYFNEPFAPIATPTSAENAENVEKRGSEIASETFDSDLAPSVELDVRSLSCPGPIVELKRTFDKLAPGAVVGLAASPTFETDLQSWARLNGVRIVRSTKSSDRLDAILQKGDAAPVVSNLPVGGEFSRRSAAIVLFSADLDKATAAAIIACGAAASGLETSVFFTFWGLSVLRKNPAPSVKKSLTARMFGKVLPLGAKKLKLSKMNFGGLGKAAMNRAMKARNVPSLDELLRRAKELGVRFVACETAMQAMGIAPEELRDVDEIAGVGRFIDLAENAGPTLFV